VLCLQAGCALVQPRRPHLHQGGPAPAVASGNAKELVAAATALADCSRPLSDHNEALELARQAVAAGGGREADLALTRCALLVASLEDDKARAYRVAREGYAAARRAGSSPDDPVVAYYEAAHLGLIVREQGIRALGRLPELESLFKSACRRPQTDQGGPLRALGMLYLRAPAWPKGIGDLELSLEHLERAVREFPLHPTNHLFYARALKEDDRVSEAKESLRVCLDLIRRGTWGDCGRQWEQQARELL